MYRCVVFCCQAVISVETKKPAGRLKTVVLFHKTWFTALLSRKTQHTHFEHRMLRKFAGCASKVPERPDAIFLNSLWLKDVKNTVILININPFDHSWISGENKFWTGSDPLTSFRINMLLNQKVLNRSEIHLVTISFKFTSSFSSCFVAFWSESCNC